jgi:hypothetical protein
MSETSGQSKNWQRHRCQIFVRSFIMPSDDANYRQKVDEVDRLLNDPSVPLDPIKIWQLLDDALSAHDVEAFNSGMGSAYLQGSGQSAREGLTEPLPPGT